MHLIIAGTNRPKSNSRKIADLVVSTYEELGVAHSLIDLSEIPLELLNGNHYGASLPPEIQSLVDETSRAQGIHLIVPEYNGSYPGILKYFIDFWKYPDSFEYRPNAFVGLGGRFGGLRPVEHLQQVFGYRSSFIYPDRVFLFNIWSLLKDGTLKDELSLSLLRAQTEGFAKFSEALMQSKLHYLTRARIASTTTP